MSDGIDVPGEVLAGAVVAQAVGKSLGGTPGGPGAHADAHAANCANCGAVLGGRYCQQCGQAAHVHRSLLHMVEELLHGIFHFETKAWRTLPLLMFRPGRLTREYIDGRRVRYVGPLPLFLFMMFAMFMVFSLTGHHEDSGATKAVAVGAEGRAQAAEAAAELAKAQAALSAMADNAPGRAEELARVKALEKKISQLTLVPSITIDTDDDETDAAAAAASGAASAVASAHESASASDAPRREKHKAPLTEERLHGQLLDAGMTWLATPSFEHKIVHAYNNKELALYKIKNGAAKYAILLVPMTLPFLWLLFALRRGVNMFDHAVFSFYSLSAMAVWMSLVAVLGALHLGGAAASVAVFAPPIHLFVQMRGTYTLSRWGALWRTTALMVYALIALTLYGLIVVLLSM